VQIALLVKIAALKMGVWDVSLAEPAVVGALLVVEPEAVEVVEPALQTLIVAREKSVVTHWAWGAPVSPSALVVEDFPEAVIARMIVIAPMVRCAAS
jgi:hypothetical protein